MRFPRLILLLAALVGATVSLHAQSPTRRDLLHENEKLAHQADSLQRVIAALQDSLSAAKSALEEAQMPAAEEQAAQWYTEQMSAFPLEDDGSEEGSDLERLSLDVPDSVYVERIAAIRSAIPLTYNDDVRRWIGIYLRKKSLPQLIGLSRYYFPILEEAFLSYGLPEELKYLAVVESEFKPTAKSHKGAQGLMQFMPGTAKQYGLVWDSFRDDRLDPFKAADAAARLLADNYRRFQDWPLAITAYDFGPGNVQAALERANLLGQGQDYHSAREHFFGSMGRGKLSQEAREYMGKFVAAAYVFHYYPQHGIVADEAVAPTEMVEFEVTDLLHFQQVSDLVGVPIETLQRYNPQYYRQIIRGRDGDVLRIPSEYIGDFVAMEDSVYLHKRDELLGPRVIIRTASGEVLPAETTYTVVRGDNLSKIAHKFGVKIDDIKRWNKLKNNNLRIGQVLIINGAAPQSGSSGSSSSKETYINYTVKSGDTLSKIARNHKVTVANLKKWNSLTSDNLKPGQVLKIRK